MGEQMAETSSLEGKVAFITGAARGQGRAHAVRLAREGADIIAADLCHDVATIDYPQSTPEDLAETVALVEAEGRRGTAVCMDLLDLTSVDGAVVAWTADSPEADLHMRQDTDAQRVAIKRHLYPDWRS